jgi:hypothetical protein
VATYIPFLLEGLKIAKSARDRLVCQVGLVLLQQAAARLGVVGFGDRVLEVRLLEAVKGDDDAVDFGERIVEVALGVGGGQLDLLRTASQRAYRDSDGQCSYLIEVDGRRERRAGDVGRRRIG